MIGRWHHTDPATAPPPFGVYFLAEYDFNRDGVIDGDDLDPACAWEYEGRGSAANHGITDSTRPWQTILTPGPNNPIGYCGYVYVKENGRYPARFRWCDPATGRRLEMDPATLR